MTSQNKTKLIFVYNADSGLFNTVTDIAHKIISPKTYSCNLCSLTHGYFSIRDTWVKFLQQLDVECEFLHRDELLSKYAIESTELPVIYENKKGRIEVWIEKEKIEQFKSVEELMKFINMKLSFSA